MIKEYTFVPGDFAYLVTEGEIVKITGCTREEGFLTADDVINVYSLKSLCPITNEPLNYFDCNKYALMPILDENVQRILSLVYDCSKFSNLVN